MYPLPQLNQSTLSFFRGARGRGATGWSPAEWPGRSARPAQTPSAGSAMPNPHACTRIIARDSASRRSAARQQTAKLRDAALLQWCSALLALRPPRPARGAGPRVPSRAAPPVPPPVVPTRHGLMAGRSEAAVQSRRKAGPRRLKQRGAAARANPPAPNPHKRAAQASPAPVEPRERPPLPRRRVPPWGAEQRTRPSPGRAAGAGIRCARLPWGSPWHA